MSRLYFYLNILFSITYIFILVSPNFLLGNNWSAILLICFVYLFLYSITSLKVYYSITFIPLVLSLIQLLYYFNIHKSLVSALLIEITLFESNWKERLTIIADHILLFTVCSLLIVLIWKFSKKVEIRKKYFYLLIICMVSISLLIIYNTKNSVEYKRKHIDNSYHLKSIALINVKQIFPLNFVRNTWTAYLTHKKASTYVKNTQNFSFGYPKLEGLDEDIVVLVIGESSRSSSFGLNNKNVATTPRLEKHSNLISFKNVFSPYSSTARSVPFSLSRVTLENWNSDIYKEKSIVSAMKELGYTTYTIDNQEPNTGLLDFYKKEVDFYLQTKEPMSYDENIIPIFDSIIKIKKNPKKFILIHSYGSHYTYSSRYPREMAQFIPDQSNGTEIKYKKEINNAYLNTINYVDFFLDELINTAEPYKASLLYFSDHGENLFDDEKELILHGYATPNNHTLNVPLIFWISETKKVDYHNLLESGNLNKEKRISTESIFPSILQLTKLDSSYYQIDRNIFYSKFKTLDKVQYFDENNVLNDLNYDEEN